MRSFSIFRIATFICLLFFTSIPCIVIATAPGTFVEWTTKCLKNLKEHPFSLPADIDNGLILPLSEKNKTLLKSSFESIGSPELKPLIDQYNTNHPKKSTLEKPGFVQKLVLTKDSELCIIGDIHGSLHSLLRILWRLILKGFLDIRLQIIKPDFYMIFTGDYVDRGRRGVEVLITLLILANQNKDKVFLLRGNHEEGPTNVDYGFSSELNAKYGEVNGPIVFNLICDWYSHLPLALFVSRNGIFAQCCHGGIESTFDAKDFLSSPDLIRDLGIDRWQGFSWGDFKYRGILISSSEERTRIPGGKEVSKYLVSGLHYIFRGHQDKQYGLKMCIAGKEAPVHWKSIITDIPASGTKIIKLNDTGPGGKPKYEPVYTFSTATEGVGVQYDCYGIVKIGTTLDDWTLTPYEFELADKHPEKPVNLRHFYIGPPPSEEEKENYQHKLDEYFNGSFAIIKKNPTTSFDPLDISPSGWQKTPPDNPIFPEILTGAATTTKLPGLKQSLENLKIKLDQLKTKITKLKKPQQRPPSKSFFTTR